MAMAWVDMRQIFLASFLLIGISGTALVIGSVSKGASSESGNAQERVEDRYGDEDQESAEDTPVTAKNCLDLQDPRDPLRDTSAIALHEDQILDLVNTDAEYARELISECGNLAAAVRSKMPSLQMFYSVARLELALDRREDAADHLRAISDVYPSAAWRLARMTIEDRGELEVNSSEFDETLALLAFAHRGRETRGDSELARLLLKIVPTHELSFPTLAASVYFKRQMPDSDAARMAMISYFDGFHRYCDQWETFVIAPADLAAVNNARIEMQVDRFLQLFKALPDWAGDMKQWLGNAGGITLEQGLRDFNTAVATPTQLLYIINNAAYRDGYHEAQTIKCTGAKAERTIVNITEMLRERSNAKMAPTNAADLQALMRKPDLISLM